MDAGERFDDFYQHLARAEHGRVIEPDALHSMYGWDMIRKDHAHHAPIEATCARAT